MPPSCMSAPLGVSCLQGLSHPPPTWPWLRRQRALSPVLCRPGVPLPEAGWPRGQEGQQAPLMHQLPCLAGGST